MSNVFPLTYWGNLSYYQALFLAEDPIFEIWETYPRHAYRNRCEIYGTNGIVGLSVPINKPFGSKSLMKDILINLNDNWAEKHWKSIQSAYAKSPYFEHYSDAVKAILFQKHTNLLDLNKSIAQWVLEKLDKNIEIQVTTSFQEASKKRLKQFSVRNLNFPRYYQTFEEKYGFQPDLSIIDGLMNLGPELRIHLKN